MYNGKYAIVIGGSHFNSLGLVRSLGEAGIKSVYINMAKWSYAENSKYVLETFHTQSENEIINSIINAVHKYGGKPVIYPTCDYSALLIDNNYDKLKDLACCPGCQGKLNYYIQKNVMCELAEKSGFIVPKTDLIDVDENFKYKLENFPIPFILKPVSNMAGSKVDIRICREKENIDSLVEHFSNYKKILIQQYVHGKENISIDYSGCKTYNSPAISVGEIRKIREYPNDGGSTSYAVVNQNRKYIDLDTLNKFLELTEFNGLFDLDFKIVDGIPYFLEINYRNGAISYAYTRSGFNAPAIWYNQQKELPFDVTNIKKLYFMCEGLDFGQVIDKNIKLSVFLKDFIKAKAFMILNAKDIMPVLGITKMIPGYIDSKIHRY